MAYNRYRKRHYNISKTKARNYAEEMDKLADSFINGQYKDWSISTMMDSCYHTFDDPMVTIRLSNHSADNKYHDLSGDSSDYVLVNIKSSKLEFTDKIDNFVPTVLEKLKEVDLKKYRYINIINDNMNCYYRGFKTKKDSFEISSQMSEIEEGLESKVDASLYADPKEEKAPESSLKDLVSNDIKNSVDVNRYYEVDAWQEKAEQLEGEDSISRFALDEDVEEFYDAHKTEIESKIDGMSKLLDLDKESILGISDESSKIDYKRSASIVAYHLSMSEIKNEIENGSFQIPPMSDEQENKILGLKSIESNRDFDIE